MERCEPTFGPVCRSLYPIILGIPRRAASIRAIARVNRAASGILRRAGAGGISRRRVDNDDLAGRHLCRQQSEFSKDLERFLRLTNSRMKCTERRSASSLSFLGLALRHPRHQRRQPGGLRQARHWSLILGFDHSKMRTTVNRQPGIEAVMESRRKGRRSHTP